MSAAAKTHGMDKERVDPDWPALTLAEMRVLLAQFPACGVPLKILFVSPRPFSAACVIETTNGRVFIKRHHRSVRDREGLLEEHRFLAHLIAHGAPVPRVFASALGETAIEIGEWTYEVHEAPEGADIYEDALSWTPFLSTAHARSAGQALARLHLASQGFDAPRRKMQPLIASFTIFGSNDSKVAMENYLVARPALAGNAVARESCEEALALLAPFFAEMKPKLSAIEPLWTHNDLHASNLLWSDASRDARVASIIDFGLADCTNAAHDMAQAIERNIVEWLDIDPASSSGEEVRVHFDQLEELLDGYDSLRPLTSDEAAALAPMTALCHAEFALSEAYYFLSMLHSEEKMRVALIDYLVGHARWFGSSGGAKLLDAIRQWTANRERRMAVTGANSR